MARDYDSTLARMAGNIAPPFVAHDLQTSGEVDADQIGASSVLVAVAIIDHIRQRSGATVAAADGFDALVEKLALEPLAGIKPLLPDPRFGQDVAMVAYLIDSLRATINGALSHGRLESPKTGQEEDR